MGPLITTQTMKAGADMEKRENGLQLHYEKYHRIIEGLTLMSDALMRNVLKRVECAEYVLRIILNNKNLTIDDVIIQQDHKNLQGRSAVLDCVARDEMGNRFDVEVQQDVEGASPKRARYHSGLLDMNTLNPGEDFDALPESYIIFIVEDDVTGDGLPVYHVERKVKETGKNFGDQSYIIYVNSAIQNDTELGRLMHDFHCKDPDNMYSQVLADQIRMIKKTQEGVDDMCREMEKIYNEGVEDGLEKGMERKARETAINLSELGVPVETIASAVKVSIKEVQEWLAGSAKPI